MNLGSKLLIVVLALGLFSSADTGPRTAASSAGNDGAAMFSNGKATTNGRSEAGSATAAPSASHEELVLIRDALAAQQQQIRQLQEGMAQRDRQIQKLEQQLQSMSPAPVPPESASISGTQSAEADNSKPSGTSSEAAPQEEQKRVSPVESLLSRFRLNGDIRVRQEDFFQSFDGCVSPNCDTRVRERIRLRLGIQGKLNEDFIGGLYIASGVLTDPTSTNETLTNFFEKKAIGFDRGYITYNPVRHKWLSLTGGKFAYTWNRTSQTFDPDLNPEGFSEKLSWDLNAPFIKSFTANGIQMFFNEASKGADSFAAGGQIASKLEVGKLWTITPSYTLLNWRNIDAILNAAPAVTGATTVGPFAPNGMTNATFTDAAGTRHFASQFLYSDLILGNQVKTPIRKLPFNLTLEYENNLNAATNQSHMYFGEAGFGQQKERGDWNFGYAFLRQEQDSVIASFDESDQRSPTNVVQHRVFLQYKVRNNTQLAFTDWIGRTLNVNLVNAAKATGLPAGRQDPWLNRLQFDLIYSF